ncbi:MAG: sigma-70 family RNA polymerase sigma factor [Nocardioidaceae bacterium]
MQPPLLRYLTVRGNDSPEDLAAETWLQVVRDLAKFQGGLSEFRSWVFTVARNRAIDHGRARAARPSVPVAEPTPTEVVASAEAVVMDHVSTEAALALVATLPPEQAELVMLRVVADLDVAEVARIVGKKPGTVRVGVHRALKALSRELSTSDTRKVV